MSSQDERVLIPLRCGCKAFGVDLRSAKYMVLQHAEMEICKNAKRLQRRFALIWKQLIPRLLDMGADDYHLGKISLFYWYEFLTKPLDEKQFFNQAKTTLRDSFKALKDQYLQVANEI